LIDLISTQKRKLRAFAAVLTAVCLGLIISARAGWVIHDLTEKRGIGFLCAPFFLLGVILLLLMYESWFRSKSSGPIFLLKQGFFWLLSVTYVIILAWFFGHFLL
jgi:hypothetical protein